MNNVFLQAGVSAELKLDDHPTLRLMPMWRRMTALQKSVMSVLVKAVTLDPALFEHLKHLDAPIYFTSAYGEVSAMLRVTQDIEANSLPISPKDFQHSVLNAAIAYLCMHQQSQQPGFALSGGYESQDLALHLAARRIAAGLDSAALIIHAHEWSDVDPKNENARAELLVLSAVKEERSRFSLQTVDQSYDRTESSDAEGSRYDEDQAEGSIAWLLKDGRPELKRCLRNSFGLELRSVWQEIT
ncbi:MAG: beta-ketoacyl synthase chain length factor [Chitinophagaceae bacterium]|nr:beta-ketoacyl synthase chain length factor [Oligoflexus sp.]